MTILLKDIIDLDFLLSLDDAPENSDADLIAARDRDIFRQINTPDLDDTALVLRWLEFRKLLFFHEAGNEGALQLPGTLYAALYRWTARGLILGGGLLGLVMAYSFLAYHGSRPVNVTLFIAFFIIFQALLSLMAGGMMIRRIRLEKTGKPGGKPAFFHTLIFEFFYSKVQSLAGKAMDLPGGRHLKALADKGAVIRMKNREYKGIIFWPFFTLSSFFALGFSTGALGGTLFRVLVTDLAFGWQSTLFTSGDQIHTFVSWLALPWAWLDIAAVPSLAQIEGSRILLKDGIVGLATENLVAWWPFLCTGVLVYGVMLRLVLILGAGLAEKNALARFDFRQPGYKRLVMRMRSPRMDVEIKETGGSQAASRAPLPDPAVPGRAPAADAGTEKVPPAADEKGEGENIKAPGRTTPALVLASSRVYPDIESISAGLEGQLGLEISGITHICFDFSGDESVLLDKASGCTDGPVVVLQEVWQPPIRGLLHYYVQLKTRIFPDNALWIFLTQTPGEEDMGVPAGDVNYQVWKTAVAQLKDPDIILERWMS